MLTYLPCKKKIDHSYATSLFAVHAAYVYKWYRFSETLRLIYVVCVLSVVEIICKLFDTWLRVSFLYNRLPLHINLIHNIQNKHWSSQLNTPTIIDRDYLVIYTKTEVRYEVVLSCINIKTPVGVHEWSWLWPYKLFDPCFPSGRWARCTQR